MMSLSIGILAGMGPRSTAPFIERLVDECQQQYGARHDMDFPLMHIISLPTPFYPGQKTDDTAMEQALRRGITQLVQAGVGVIAVPCNLAHCYFSTLIEAAQGIPVLHIADSAIQTLPASADNVIILATEPVLDSGIYQQRLQHSGRTVIESAEVRELTTRLITEIKQQGYAAPQVAELWQRLQTLTADAKALLIACTDISPLIHGQHPQQVITDTAASLAEATIRYYVNTQKTVDNVRQ